MVANAQSNIKSTTLKSMKTWKKLLMKLKKLINKKEQQKQILKKLSLYCVKYQDVIVTTIIYCNGFQCDKDNSDKNNINYIEIEIANESNDEYMPSHVKAFESFEKKTSMV